MSDMAFMGVDGKTHRPSDPDYWQAKVRDMESTIKELQTAIMDLQNRVVALDGGELHWPADTYPPPYPLPPAR